MEMSVGIGQQSAPAQLEAALVSPLVSPLKCAFPITFIL